MIMQRHRLFFLALLCSTILLKTDAVLLKLLDSPAPVHQGGDEIPADTASARETQIEPRAPRNEASDDEIKIQVQQDNDQLEQKESLPLSRFFTTRRRKGKDIESGGGKAGLLPEEAKVLPRARVPKAEEPSLKNTLIRTGRIATAGLLAAGLAGAVSSINMGAVAKLYSHAVRQSAGPPTVVNSWAAERDGRFRANAKRNYYKTLSEQRHLGLHKMAREQRLQNEAKLLGIPVDVHAENTKKWEQTTRKLGRQNGNDNGAETFHETRQDFSQKSNRKIGNRNEALKKSAMRRPNNSPRAHSAAEAEADVFYDANENLPAESDSMDGVEKMPRNARKLGGLNMQMPKKMKPLSVEEEARLMEVNAKNYKQMMDAMSQHNSSVRDRQLARPSKPIENMEHLEKTNPDHVNVTPENYSNIMDKVYEEVGKVRDGHLEHPPKPIKNMEDLEKTNPDQVTPQNYSNIMDKVYEEVGKVRDGHLEHPPKPIENMKESDKTNPDQVTAQNYSNIMDKVSEKLGKIRDGHLEHPSKPIENMEDYEDAPE